MAGQCRMPSHQTSARVRILPSPKTSSHMSERILGCRARAFQDFARIISREVHSRGCVRSSTPCPTRALLRTSLYASARHTILGIPYALAGTHFCHPCFSIFPFIRRGSATTGMQSHRFLALSRAWLHYLRFSHCPTQQRLQTTS